MKRQLLALVVVLGIGIGCSSSDGGLSPPPGPPPPPPPPPPPNTVIVAGTSFTPPDLSVSRNTTVTWNFQGGPHTVTFEDGQGNSGQRSSGSHTRQFGTAGTFRYRCEIHSGSFGDGGMNGTVTVGN